MNCVLFVGCSRRKVSTITAITALELYSGGGIPEIRDYVAQYPVFRERIFILSAKYGLLGADDRIKTYDAVLSLDAALVLRKQVWADIQQRVLLPFAPDTILVLAEPLYFALLGDLLEHTPPARIIWEPDIHNGVQRIIQQMQACGTATPELNRTTGIA